MQLCAVSFKECWQDAGGQWMSDGGFPLQMAAIGSMFDAMELVIVGVEPRAGGLPLPAEARVVALPRPRGENATRKLFLALTLPRYLQALMRHVRRADVIHTPLPGDIPLLAMLVALGFRKRLLVRYGSSWATTNQTSIMNRLTKAAMRLFAGGRRVMLATGEGADPPAEGVQWIFATALSDSELQSSRPVLTRGLSDPPRLAYVGRLSPEKGVAVLVAAIAALDRRRFRPMPRLTLIGDGPDRRRLEAQVSEHGCQNVVEFTGQLGRARLNERLREMDLCVQPSLTEGFSKAWLDGMAQGLPLLASEVGAARQVIGGEGLRGWLTPPGDPQLLAEKLASILAEERDWPALRRRCREFAETRSLELWREKIALACAAQWGWKVTEGKLRP